MSVRFLTLQPNNPPATNSPSSRSEGERDHFGQVFADVNQSHRREDSGVNARSESNDPVADVDAKVSDRRDREGQPIEENGPRDASDSNQKTEAGSHDAVDHDGKSSEKSTKTRGYGTQGEDRAEVNEADKADADAVQVIEPIVVEPVAPVPIPVVSAASDGNDPDGGNAGDAEIATSELTVATDEVETQTTQLNETTAASEAASASMNATTPDDAQRLVAPTQTEGQQPRLAQGSDSASQTDSLRIEGGLDAAAQTVGEQSTQSNTEDAGDNAFDPSANRSLGNQATANATNPFALPGSTSTTESTPTDGAAIATALPSSSPTPAVSAPAPLAQPDAPDMRDEANIARVTRGLATAVNQRGGNVTLRLDPPELGQVRIEMAVRDGVVNARITAQTDSVRRLLTDQLGHLRNALDRQGLSIERLEVQTSNSNGSGWNDSQDDNGEPNDGRSRGRHSSSQRQSSGHGEGQDADASTDTFESQLNRAE